MTNTAYYHSYAQGGLYWSETFTFICPLTKDCVQHVPFRPLVLFSAQGQCYRPRRQCRSSLEMLQMYLETYGIRTKRCPSIQSLRTQTDLFYSPLWIYAYHRIPCSTGYYYIIPEEFAFHLRLDVDEMERTPFFRVYWAPQPRRQRAPHSHGPIPVPLAHQQDFHYREYLQEYLEIYERLLPTPSRKDSECPLDDPPPPLLLLQKDLDRPTHERINERIEKQYWEEVSVGTFESYQRKRQEQARPDPKVAWHTRWYAQTQTQAQTKEV